MNHSTIDWTALKADKLAGISVKELAAKYGISTAGIYNHFRSKPAPVNVKAATNGNGRTSAGYSQVIADLIERRDKLNAAIATLEELQAA